MKRVICIVAGLGFLVFETPARANEFCDGLWRARNAVFARNGHCFKSPKAQAIFGNACFPPYGKLSSADKAMVEKIRALEREGNCQTVAASNDSSANTKIPKYTVIVTLSPKAKAKLKASGETMRVDAVYFGEAKPGAPADETGEVQLGTEAKDIVPGGSVSFGGQTLPAKDVDNIVGGRPQLLINVYSSRKVFPDNILDCGIWQDDAAKAATLPISCKLIGEK